MNLLEWEFICLIEAGNSLLEYLKLFGGLDKKLPVFNSFFQLFVAVYFVRYFVGSFIYQDR